MDTDAEVLTVRRRKTDAEAKVPTSAGPPGGRRFAEAARWAPADDSESVFGNAIPVFSSWIRENKTLFADAPEYGVPVVLTNQNAQTYRTVVKELEQFVDEFQEGLGL